MIKKINVLSLIYVIGFAIVIVASLAHFFRFDPAKYFFSAGAILLIAERLIVMFRAADIDFRKQRLQRMQLMLSLVLALAAWSMFEGTTLWIAAVLIYALVTLFLSFRF
jgi:hypothetical protein